MISKLARLVLCMWLRRHRYVIQAVAGAGVAIGIPACVRCGRVDASGIKVEAWNRMHRRHDGRQVRRAIRRRFGHVA